MGEDLGLVLGSGGARGYALVPFLEKLDELGIVPDIVSGCSIGSLMGSYYCVNGSADGLLQSILENRDGGHGGTRKFGNLWTSRYDGDSYYRWLSEKHLKGRTFSQLRIPLVVTATDLDRMRTVYFRNGSVAMAVRASTSFPGYYPPFVIEGVRYGDGAILMPVPVEVLRKRGVKRMIAFSLTHFNDAEPMRSASAYSVARRAIWGMAGELSRRSCRGKDVFTIAPRFPMTLRTLMSMTRIEENMAIGRDAVERHMPALLRWLESDE